MSALEQTRDRCRLEELLGDVVAEAKKLSPELGVEFLAEVLQKWATRAERHVPIKELLEAIEHAD